MASCADKNEDILTNIYCLNVYYKIAQQASYIFMNTCTGDSDISLIIIPAIGIVRSRIVIGHRHRFTLTPMTDTRVSRYLDRFSHVLNLQTLGGE